jgi:hypothetical protein
MAAAADCIIPQRWPPDRARLSRLRNIGKVLEAKWEAEDIFTLRDLVNRVRGNSLAENKRLFKRVFRNERAGQCLPHSSISDTKYWAQPWSQHAVQRRPAPGNFKYCVGLYNKCGWMTVEAYLRQSPLLTDAEKTKIPPYEIRTNFCRTKRFCRQQDVAAPQAPQAQRMALAQQILNAEPLPADNARGKAEIRRRYGVLFGRLDNPTNLQRIAIVLWHHPKGHLDTGDIAYHTRLRKKAVAALVGQNRADRNKGQNLFVFDNDEQSLVSLVPELRNEREEHRFFNNIRVRAEGSPQEGGGGSHGGGAPILIIRYYVDKNDPESLQFIEDFRRTLKRTLADPIRGIGARSGIQYREVINAQQADIIVRLVSQAKVNEACSFSTLSCSIVMLDKTKPDRILFSLENWKTGNRFQGTIEDYRTYLINHEFLHCRPFRRDHPTKFQMQSHCAARLPTPVMYQQSLGLPPEYNTCTPNVWPLKKELVLLK